VNNAFNISEEELEQIDNYLNNKLTATELAAFRRRMDADKLWREKVSQVQLISLGIQESLLADRLNDFHKELKPQEEKKTHRTISFHWGKRWAIAASALLVIGTLSWILFFKKTDNQQLFASYYQPDPGLPTLMGVSDHYEFDKAMVDYKTGDYEKALIAWKTLLKENEQNDTLNYFIASAYLAYKNPEMAFPYFDKVIRNPNSVFYNDAQWYKALALLDEGKKEEAVQLLQKTEHPEKETLLRKLNEE